MYKNLSQIKTDIAPTFIVHETQRLAVLDGLDILDTPAEEGFDDLVNLAALAYGVPVALVSLVEDDRQWLKAWVDFPPARPTYAFRFGPFT